MSTPDFLNPQAALLLHHQQIEAFGGTHGVRDYALLESAVRQAQQTWAYTNDMHETVAQYGVFIAHNHLFVDGNKRTAAACMLVFLDMNDMKINYSPEDIFAWAMKMVIAAINREELAKKLRSNIKR